MCQQFSLAYGQEQSFAILAALAISAIVWRSKSEDSCEWHQKILAQIQGSE